MLLSEIEVCIRMHFRKLLKGAYEFGMLHVGMDHSSKANVLSLAMFNPHSERSFVMSEEYAKTLSDFRSVVEIRNSFLSV